MSLSCNEIEEEFPSWSLVPKRETKIDSFHLKYPHYDGRETIIAFIDSGIDPGAPGLQKTSDGKIKVLRRLDCTGCGDVILSEPMKPVNNCLNGSTVRKLKIPETWTNPTGLFRVGIKNIYDLFPKEIREKVKNEYKEEWLKQHKICCNDEDRNFVNFEDKINKSDLSYEIKLNKEDNEAKINVLKDFEKNFIDTGPVYDCVVFHDGSKWNACLDTTEVGNLALCDVIGEYNVTYEYALLSKKEHVNYSINVHEDGKVLELVGLSSSHGTSCASLAASYFAEDSDRNGIAPGAQIVSLMVCDNRLNGAVTASAFIRAIISIMKLSKENPVVVHSSEAVHALRLSTSRIGTLINEVIDKYRCPWIADAGHYGPALCSSLSAPLIAGQDSVIGVGAFVSPEMMSAVHSLRQKLSGTIYTWSSRGPLVDGSSGISICSPGVSIFSLPSSSQLNPEENQYVSGASAYVAGAVALLLSGILSEKKYISPYVIKRALENGANVLEETESLAQGHGLLNVESSYEILSECEFLPEDCARFDVTCSPDKSKGIFIISTESDYCQEWSITIKPKFTEDTPATKKINFNLKLLLECDAFYVNHPKFLSMTNIARTISVKIDTKNIKYGSHSTSIRAYNTSEKGRKRPIFSIPITVVKSKEINEDYTYISKRKIFTPNTIKRHFFKVPEKATWAVFNLNCLTCNDFGNFTLHCVQILPKKSGKTFEKKFDMKISTNTENVKSFKVEGGFVLEVTLAKNWNSFGNMNVQYSISFHGIKLNKPLITMLAVEGIQRVDVTTLRGEEVNPNIVLNYSVKVLDCVEAKVKPLTSRDLIPEGRQIYEIIQSYNFTLAKPTEVTLLNPFLSDVLDQTEFESYMWMIFSNNKQCLGCGDSNSTNHFVKLEKGTYTVKSQIRHDKKESLDKFVAIPLLLKMKLINPITMDVYPSYVAALLTEKKPERFQENLPPSVMPLFINSLSSEKYNVKVNNAADYLVGTAVFAKDELGKVDDYPIKYILFKNENGKKNSDKSKTNKCTKLDEYNEALKELKNTWLKKIDDADEVEALYVEIEQGFPNDLQAHINMLRHLQPFEPKVQLPALNEDEIKKYNVEELQNRILPLCENNLRNLDHEEILCHFASKIDSKDDLKLKESMKLKKNALVESLCHKGITLCRLYQYSQTNKESNLECKPTLRDVSDIWETLCKFVDIKDKNVEMHVLIFASWHAAVNKHYGRLLKFLLKYQEDKSYREIDEKCIEICELLKWRHIANHIKRNLLSKYPKEYKPF